jgi:hypothetical protein
MDFWQGTGRREQVAGAACPEYRKECDPRKRILLDARLLTQGQALI